MKKIAAAATVLAASLAAASAAADLRADHIVDAAVASFYDALGGAPGTDIMDLLRRATAPEWVSCGANDVCRARDDVIAAIAARRRDIPDLKWEIKEMLVSGDRVIVRGEASGTPTADFMGVPYGGKSFKLMSIDIHTLRGGKLIRSYHVEDWMGATRQLSTAIR
jgi:predicted ester cyclase